MVLVKLVVPDDASKIVDFQTVIKLTSDFETALKGMRFISASDNMDDRLSNFIDNVEVHFASRKKVEILAKARNLLLQSEFVLSQEHTRQVTKFRKVGAAERFPDHVVDLLFLSERCAVSKAASQLVELVHLTLRDVCLSSPRVAWEFYHPARDALLLYEAIIPVKQEKQLDGINQVAVLIHNDCLYLSQEILGLAFEPVDFVFGLAGDTYEEKRNWVLKALAQLKFQAQRPVIWPMPSLTVPTRVFSWTPWLIIPRRPHHRVAIGREATIEALRQFCSGLWPDLLGFCSARDWIIFVILYCWEDAELRNLKLARSFQHGAGADAQYMLRPSFSSLYQVCRCASVSKSAAG
ncbi:hypothetical protein U1Q18_014654 [Sarracenia purpurea var. burkii]